MPITKITETVKGSMITTVPAELRYYGLSGASKLRWTPVKGGKFLVERV